MTGNRTEEYCIETQQTKECCAPTRKKVEHWDPAVVHTWKRWAPWHFSENVDVRKLWKKERSICSVKEAHQPLWNKTKSRKRRVIFLLSQKVSYVCRRMTIWVRAGERNCHREFISKVTAELFSWFQCSNKCNKSPPMRLQGETSSESWDRKSVV